MYFGSFASHLGRTVLKGALIGGLGATVLAMAYLSVNRTLGFVFRPDGTVDIASGIVGFPVMFFDTTLYSFIDGLLRMFLLIGIGTGVAAALITVLLGRWLKEISVAVLCAVLALGVAAVYLSLNGGAVINAQLQPIKPVYWLPIALYGLFASWLGLRLRRGSTA